MRSQLHPATVLQKTAVALLVVFFLFCFSGYGQPRTTNNPFTDSLKRNLSGANTDREKSYWLLELADYYSGINNELSEQYAQQAMQIAELSRDRQLIAATYLKNGARNANLGGLNNYLDRALNNYQEAQKIAQANGLDNELGYSYAGQARMARAAGDYDKALNYNNLAISIASTVNNDSLKIVTWHSMGNTYLAKNEKLLAFRNYLDALNIAELSKREELLTLCYSRLSEFYADIEDYDKAIDYRIKTQRLDEATHNRYKVLEDYNATGALFTAKKQYDLALKMFENAISLADSLQFNDFKINCYLSIANMYFAGDQLAKGLQYLNSHQQLLDFFNSSHLNFFLDQGYAGIYAEMGKYDSAAYFYKKAEPEIVQHTNRFLQCNFYLQIGRYYRKIKNYPQSIAYYLKANQLGETIKDLNMLEKSSKNLDSVYTEAGDYKNAYHYNSLYNLYKDSIKTLAKETDLLKLEVDNDNKRRERLAKEEEENMLHRHNVQYMGITAGIASLFIVMVMMGFFVVSPRTIRALGFFSFIFLFEFVILLADKQIHEWTHGEPWKILFIKIALAAILLPLHHWLEHKVIHYLTTRKKIAPNSFFAAGRLLKKETAPVQ